MAQPHGDGGSLASFGPGRNASRPTDLAIRSPGRPAAPMVGIASARRMPYCLVTGDGFLTHRCRGARVLSS
ncbi:hypothetical protein, partial [Salmonella sp. SAL4451]|uniref:hypothetical protein n=1 Tax=Salmonella sp. SAL4451 TaxID=3159906 RepID=UPI00397DB6D9